MHRDVSGGNILIFPILVKSKGGVYVAYVGILADWEMSKPLDKKYPRQPERTVSYRYCKSNTSMLISIFVNRAHGSSCRWHS